MASVDELWLVDFGEPFPGEPAHHRPALVLGPPDTFGPDIPFAIVVPCTTTDRKLSLHLEVELSDDNGLDATCYVQCEQIRSINRRRLVRRLGTVDQVHAQAVMSIVHMLLGR